MAERREALREQARFIWNSDELAGRFLHSPNPNLEGRTPYDAANTESGYLDARAILGRIEHGIFA